MYDAHAQFDLSDVTPWTPRESRDTERDEHIDHDLDVLLAELAHERTRAPRV